MANEQAEKVLGTERAAAAPSKKDKVQVEVTHGRIIHESGSDDGGKVELSSTVGEKFETTRDQAEKFVALGVAKILS